MTDMENLKKTPLHDRHVALGARMVPFGGWDMPVQYSSIIEEHMHTREKAGLFDICHMGEFILRGPDIHHDISNLVTSRLENLAVGKCRYGFLTAADGTIIDDLISFRTGEDEYMLVVNAATREKDSAWIQKNLSGSIHFSDESDNLAKIDLQGPLSKEILGQIMDPECLEGIRRFSFDRVEIEGIDVLLSRTGYTGELGYELYYSAEKAALLWDRLLEFDEVKPVGLGARDTLRLEVGYPLYGHDISDQKTPVDAGFEKFVHFEKDFIGKNMLLEQIEAGVSETLMAFECEGRRAAREGFEVTHEDKVVGQVTSGAFSPCLKKAIGLCYIEKPLAQDGTPIVLRKGKTEIPGKVRSIPVYKKPS